MAAITQGKKTAIVLFNLGGPDSPEAVKPFLYNLFSDKNIIRLPGFLRHPLARLIAARREEKAQEIYSKIDGRSPILDETKKQAQALEKALQAHGEVKIFIAMRYWYPMTEITVAEVKYYEPDQVILLPLYPQFSTTTTASSLQEWQMQAKKQGMDVPTSAICCYPTERHFIASHVDAIRSRYFQSTEKGNPRILFSAHGLPEKIVRSGDPYVWQVEQTVTEILRLLAIPGLDYRICYQSRVGPLKWVGPSTEDEIRRAGRDAVPVMLVPVAFVSEHSETLVELDMEYKKLAEESGVPGWYRIPTPGVHPLFITALQSLCLDENHCGGIRSQTGERICPHNHSGCPNSAVSLPEALADAA